MTDPKSLTTAEHLAQLPADRRQLIGQLLELLRAQLPSGFEETIQYGMPGFVVPLSRYPAGYHVGGVPLPFISVASQVRHIAVYHMGIYAQPELMAWLKTALAEADCKVDIGKSCLRFNPAKPLPLAILGQLASKMTVDEWITLYETGRARPSKDHA